MMTGPRLRFAVPNDAQAILDIYAPIVRNTIISFELTPPSPSEMQERIANTLIQYPWLVCEINDMVAGYAYASQHRSRLAYQWSVDVAVYVHQTFRHRHIARALYAALFALLVEQGYYNSYAGIALPNPASIGFHEGVGFRLVGIYHQTGYKLGAWHDVGWWERRLQAKRLDPAPPLAIAGLIYNERIQESLQIMAALIR